MQDYITIKSVSSKSYDPQGQHGRGSRDQVPGALTSNMCLPPEAPDGSGGTFHRSGAMAARTLAAGKVEVSGSSNRVAQAVQDCQSLHLRIAKYSIGEFVVKGYSSFICRSKAGAGARIDPVRGSRAAVDWVMGDTVLAKITGAIGTDQFFRTNDPQLDLGGAPVDVVRSKRA